MKRLLCILSGMNAGGAEGFLMKVYRELDKSKYQMDFCINVKEKCFFEDEILAMGGKMYRIPSKSEDLAQFKKQLTKVIKENGYDNVLRITSSAMGFMDLKVAKKAGARVCCARSSNASDGDGLKAKVAHRLGRVLYNKYVDVKVAPSDLAARYTFGDAVYEKGGVNLIHNGVDLDLFKFYPEKREEIRKEFSIEDGVTLVGHVGRFDEQKNHAFLLEIFKELHGRDANTKLLLVGKGALQEKMQERAAELGIGDSVIFAGVRSDVPHLLSAMDVFAFPSFYEGMPNTVIEAQATGLPCVIADTITREADITGLVEYLPLGNAAEWAERVAAAVRSERADTHPSFISNKYDIGSVVEEFVKNMYR
ncbi:MAG: glycosyltransferase family 1 protein [Ruminococcaceae bacterium]|nr:glycosyltransferase family 1 protein [Oscillospiraceae bacterium]